MVVPGPWLRNCGSFAHTLNNAKHLEILSEYFATVTHKANIKSKYVECCLGNTRFFIVGSPAPWLGLDECHANDEGQIKGLQTFTLDHLKRII